jgi:hypothetical protein
MWNEKKKEKIVKNQARLRMKMKKSTQANVDNDDGGELSEGEEVKMNSSIIHSLFFFSFALFLILTKYD